MRINKEFIRNNPLAALIAASIALSGILLALIIINRVSYSSSTILYEMKTQEAKQKAKEEYQHLIAQQEARENPTSEIVETKRKALGKNTLHIIFVKSPSVTDEAISPLIQELTRESSDVLETCTVTCRKNMSLAYMQSFYQTQAKKYDITDFSLDIKFHGPVTLAELDQVGDFTNLWGKDIFAVQRLQDAFEKVLADNNIMPNNDLVEFIYFDSSFAANENTDPSSYYDHKKFRSFAQPEIGRAYVNAYSFSPHFSSILVEIITHETLHLFGANDKYTDNGPICTKYGRGDITKFPPTPQQTGDIMCMHIEGILGNFKNGSLIEGNLVINQKTAREIGWIND